MKCPNCKITLTHVLVWQTASIAYRKNLKTENYSRKPVEIVGGEWEADQCPDCRTDLEKSANI